MLNLKTSTDTLKWEDVGYPPGTATAVYNKFLNNFKNTKNSSEGTGCKQASEQLYLYKSFAKD